MNFETIVSSLIDVIVQEWSGQVRGILFTCTIAINNIVLEIFRDVLKAEKITFFFKFLKLIIKINILVIKIT